MTTADLSVLDSVGTAPHALLPAPWSNAEAASGSGLHVVMPAFAAAKGMAGLPAPDLGMLLADFRPDLLSGNGTGWKEQRSRKLWIRPSGP